MPPDLAEVRRWLEKARGDHEAAVLTLSPMPPIRGVAAFHCQQAVEKTLKAYLAYREHKFEKIHDLEILATACTVHEPRFEELIERVDPLTAYAVRFRYPGPADPTVEEVRAALEVVGEVWAFVLDRLPADVHPETS